MNKRGFSLVELLAVVLIISILMLLATGLYSKLQDNVLEEQYKNTVHDILNKAIEYANSYGSTEVIEINVDTLIKEGYYKPDDQDNVYDPRNDKVRLNCNKIHIVLEDGEYKATFMEAFENEDGTCQEFYIKENGLRILCNGEECKSDWYKDDVVLSLTGLDNELLQNSKVEWSSLSGDYALQNPGEEKIFNVGVSAVLNTTYNVFITTSENETYSVNQNLKVDKEVPVVIEKNIDVNYGGTQYLKYNASDMSGSGLTGVSLTRGSCNSATYKNGDIRVTEAGKFNLCLKDNAGNISSEEINISQVTFDYNNLSSPIITKIPVYYLEDNANFAMHIPTRNGYEFVNWVDQSGNRVHNFDNLKNGDVITAQWDMIDVNVSVSRADTEHVFLESKANIVMILDASGSMNHGTRAAQLRTAVKNMINSINFSNGSTVSIVQFHHGVKNKLNTTSSKSAALAYISEYSPVWGDGTNFVVGTQEAYNIVKDSNLGKDRTFVIFFTDGYDEATSQSQRVLAKSKLAPYVNTIYGIGLDVYQEAKWMIYDVISSPANYFDASSSQANLSEIFAAIEEEIREDVSEKTSNGLLAVPKLVVESEHPFVLTINGRDYSFNSIVEMMNKGLIKYSGGYSLDFVGIDNYYKLDGRLRSIKINYYYH